MNSVAFLNEWAASENLRARDCFDIYLDPHDPALKKVAYRQAGRPFILQASAFKLIVTGKLESPVFFSVGEPHPALLTDVRLSLSAGTNDPPVFGRRGFERVVKAWLKQSDRLKMLAALELMTGESLHVARNETLLILQAARDVRATSDQIVAVVTPLNEAAQATGEMTLPAGFEDLQSLSDRWAIPDDSERAERVMILSARERARLRQIIVPRLTAIDEFLSRFEGRDPLSDDVLRLQCLAELGAELKLSGPSRASFARRRSQRR